MNADKLAWVAIVVLIAGIVAAAASHYTAAWVLVAIAIVLVVYAKMKANPR